jgi:NAD(P)-dependent dehydrogenase (short-subunit alcohol dehydrogenase family)
MKIDLSGKLAIVSGSTAGIGLGIRLAESGATVVVIGRDTAKVEQAWRAFASRCRVLNCGAGCRSRQPKVWKTLRRRTTWPTSW